MAICLFEHTKGIITGDGSLSLLGGIGFGAEITHIDRASGNAPMVQIAAPLLTHEMGYSANILLTDSPVESSSHHGIQVAHSDELLFGGLVVDEHELGCGLHDATAKAYERILNVIETLGFPRLQRVWNYLPAINRETDGIERYRQFNAGRQQAFLTRRRPISGDVPPATAVGTHDGDLAFAFCAATESVQAIESPRQISAYHYPPQYGACSPVFSRAGLAQLGDDQTLLVSGTAAIVGHSSRHRHDVAAQTSETLTNLDAVIDAANESTRGKPYRLECLDYIVYLRHAQDTDTVLRLLRDRVGDKARVICVHADICRAELLVEIEAIGGRNECD